MNKEKNELMVLVILLHSSFELNFVIYAVGYIITDILYKYPELEI